MTAPTDEEQVGTPNGKKTGTVPEIAKFYEVSPEYVYTQIDKGLLAAFNLAGDPRARPQYRVYWTDAAVWWGRMVVNPDKRAS